LDPVNLTGAIDLISNFTIPLQYSTLASLTLPAGTYELQVSVQLVDTNGCCGHLDAVVNCALDGDTFSTDIGQITGVVISWHKASANASPVTVTLGCSVFSTSTIPPGPTSGVFAAAWRLTATTVGSIITQP
jgi:hypothetical protein